MRLSEIDGSNVIEFRRKKKTYNFPKPMDIDPQAAALIHRNGLEASDESMERNIGRNFMFNGQRASDGLVHLQPHRIVGVQKDYKGDLVYRAVPVDTAWGTFGCCAPPERVRFLDGGEVLPFPTGK